ncbi:MAG: aminotransferase class I/II-fold pyridoxal phosphate-dependent enzyme [Myxococcota bacterium]
MSDRIWLSAPHMGDAEQKHVDAAFRSGWLSTMGPQLNAFEEALGELAGAHCCAVASGTAAIHLGLRLLGVGPGDEVIVPTLNFVGGVNPIRYLGATPVFVDSETTTWNVDPQAIQNALLRHPKARAIVAVHLFGQTAQMDEILAIGQRHGVPVFEDAAEAVGTRYRGAQVGALGAAGAFSFNGNKMITCTSGGALLSSDEKLIEQARHLAQQARDPGIAYEHSLLGYNYRMSNVLAAIGLGQLEVLDARVARRRAIAEFYADAFAELPGIERMPQFEAGFHTNWLSVFRLREDCPTNRDQLLAALSEDNIDARPVWKPMHLQPLYREAPRVGGEVAETLFREGICLPSSSFLGQEDLYRVVDVVRREMATA